MLIDCTNPLMNALAAIQAQDFDLDRFVAAARAKPHPAPAKPRGRVLYPATSSDPCPRCGVSGWKGCDHQGAFQGVTLPKLGTRPVRWESQ